MENLFHTQSTSVHTSAHGSHAHCSISYHAAVAQTLNNICSPNIAMLIAYAKHGNILNARECTIRSTNMMDNSGTKVCGIFLCAGKICHAGCEVVRLMLLLLWPILIL